MWIKYQGKEGEFYVNTETDENVQAYGNDPRWLERKDEILADCVDYEHSEKKVEDDKKLAQSMKLMNSNMEVMWCDEQLEKLERIIKRFEYSGSNPRTQKKQWLAVDEYKQNVLSDLPNISRPKL